MKHIVILSLVTLAFFSGCATRTKPSTAIACPVTSYVEAEKVVDAYIGAMTQGDLQTCATLMHPQALTGLQDILMPIRNMAKKAGREKTFLSLFSGVTSADQLLALSKEQFFVSFLEGSLFSQPEIFEAMKTMQYTIIGSAPEGEAVVHVLYRLKMNMMGTDIEELETISLQRSGDSWRLLLSGDIKRTAEKVKAAFAPRFQ
jgi:hypothetical protein